MANASAEVIKAAILAEAMLLIEKILYFCRSFRYSKRRATESTKSSNNTANPTMLTEAQKNGAVLNFCHEFRTAPFLF